MQYILQQLKTGLETAQKTPSINPSDYSRIIFCGMGGSIMPAEAVSMLWLEDINGYINRTPYLPHWASKKDLVVCISWSGNTGETIAAHKSAKEKNIPTFAITSGGTLAELAQKDQTPLILLPSASAGSGGWRNGLAPRNAFGFMFSALLTLLSRSDIIKDSVISSFFSVEQPDSKFNQAEKITQLINGKTPLIYSSYPWRFLGSFWKKFLNENSKIHAFSNFLPEATHNEIAGVKENDQKFFYLILKDPEEGPEDNIKIDKFSEFLKNYNTSHIVLDIAGGNRLEKILNQYLLASSVSVMLAEKLGIDPDSTEIINNFKKI